jgi:hypothetical protein
MARIASSDQDTRFGNKDRKLMATMSFAKELSTKVDMTKVKLEVIKPWITSAYLRCHCPRCPPVPALTARGQRA